MNKTQGKRSMRGHDMYRITKERDKDKGTCNNTAMYTMYRVKKALSEHEQTSR